MSFLVCLLFGAMGGVLGGMGMGGGTLLIPLLTLVLGVPQRTAQGINLISFLPMAGLALSVHAGEGLVEREGLFSTVVLAAAGSFLFSFLAAYLPARVLKKLFGGFLIALSLSRARSAFLGFPRKFTKFTGK